MIDKFRNWERVLNSSKVKWCLTPDCETVIEDESRSVYHSSKMDCPTCKESMCFMCGLDYHDDTEASCEKNLAVKYMGKYCSVCRTEVADNPKYGLYRICMNCSFEFCNECSDSASRNDRHFSILNPSSCHYIFKSIRKNPI